MAKFKEGDKVICERFEGFPSFVSAMKPLVGKIGIFLKAGQNDLGEEYYVVKHECASYSWNWKPSAVKLYEESIKSEERKDRFQLIELD